MDDKLERERDAYKLACERAGVCMTCVIQAPETYGCPDCINTGYIQGDPYERIKQLEAQIKPDVCTTCHRNMKSPGFDGCMNAKCPQGFEPCF